MSEVDSPFSQPILDMPHKIRSNYDKSGATANNLSTEPDSDTIMDALQVVHSSRPSSDGHHSNDNCFSDLAPQYGLSSSKQPCTPRRDRPCPAIDGNMKVPGSPTTRRSRLDVSKALDSSPGHTRRDNRFTTVREKIYRKHMSVDNGKVLDLSDIEEPQSPRAKRAARRIYNRKAAQGPGRVVMGGTVTSAVMGGLVTANTDSQSHMHQASYPLTHARPHTHLLSHVAPPSTMPVTNRTSVLSAGHGAALHVHAGGQYPHQLPPPHTHATQSVHSHPLSSAPVYSSTTSLSDPLSLPFHATTQSLAVSATAPVPHNHYTHAHAPLPVHIAYPHTYPVPSPALPAGTMATTTYPSTVLPPPPHAPASTHSHTHTTSLSLSVLDAPVASTSAATPLVMDPLHGLTVRVGDAVYVLHSASTLPPHAAAAPSLNLATAAAPAMVTTSAAAMCAPHAGSGAEQQLHARAAVACAVSSPSAPAVPSLTSATASTTPFFTTSTDTPALISMPAQGASHPRPDTTSHSLSTTMSALVPTVVPTSPAPARRRGLYARANRSSPVRDATVTTSSATALAEPSQPPLRSLSQRQPELHMSVVAQPPPPQSTTYAGLYRRSARSNTIVTTSATASTATATVVSASVSTAAVVAAPASIYRRMSGRVPAAAAQNMSTDCNLLNTGTVDAAADAACAAVDIVAYGTGVLASFGAATAPVRVCIPAEMKKSKEEITAQRTKKAKSGAGNISGDVGKSDGGNISHDVREQASVGDKSERTIVERTSDACDEGCATRVSAGAAGAEVSTAEHIHVGMDTTGVVVAGVVVKKSRYRRQVRVYQGAGSETATAAGKSTDRSRTAKVVNENATQNAEKRADNRVNEDDVMEKGDKRDGAKEPVKRSMYRRSRKPLQAAVAQAPTTTSTGTTDAKDSKGDGKALESGAGLDARDIKTSEKAATPARGANHHRAGVEVTNRGNGVDNVQKAADGRVIEVVDETEEEEEDSDCEFLRSIMAQATSREYAPPTTRTTCASGYGDGCGSVSVAGESRASAGEGDNHNTRHTGSVIAGSRVFNNDVQETTSQLPTLAESASTNNVQSTSSMSQAPRAPTTAHTPAGGRLRPHAPRRSPGEPPAQATRFSPPHSIVTVTAATTNVNASVIDGSLTDTGAMTHDGSDGISDAEDADRASGGANTAPSVDAARTACVADVRTLPNDITVSGGGSSSEATLGRGVSFSSVATTQAFHDTYSTTGSLPASPRTSPSSSFSTSSTNPVLPSSIPVSMPIVLTSPRIRLYKAAYDITSPPAPVRTRPSRRVFAGTDSNVVSSIDSTTTLGSSVEHVTHTVDAAEIPALARSLSADSDDTISDTNPFLRLSQTQLTGPSTASSPPSPAAYTPPPPLQAGPLLLERHSLAGHAVQRPVERGGSLRPTSAGHLSINSAAFSVCGALASRAVADEDCYTVGSGVHPLVIESEVVRGSNAIGDTNSDSAAKSAGTATTQHSLATAVRSQGRKGMRRAVSLLLQDSDDDRDVFVSSFSSSSSSSSTLDANASVDTICRKGEAIVDSRHRSQEHGTTARDDEGSGADDDDLCVIEVRSPLQTRNDSIRPQNTRTSTLINSTNTAASACSSPLRHPASPQPSRFLSPTSPRPAFAPLSPHSSPRFLSPAAHAHKAWCSPVSVIRGRAQMHTQQQAQQSGVYHDYGAAPYSPPAHITHAVPAQSSPFPSRGRVGYPSDGVFSPRKPVSGACTGDGGGHPLDHREYLANVDIISIDDEEPVYVPAPVYGKRSIFSHYGLSGVAARGGDADQENRPESSDAGAANAVWLRRRRRRRENTNTNDACGTVVSTSMSIKDMNGVAFEAHSLKRRKTSPVDCATPSPRRVNTDTHAGDEPTWDDDTGGRAGAHVPLSVRRRATFVSPLRTVVDAQ